MNCRQARNLFGAYWDDELTQAEREWLESHFASCPTCRTSYEDLGRTLEWAASLPRVEVKPDFAEQVLARARRATAEPDRLATTPPRWIALTAAAALVAVIGATIFQWVGPGLTTLQREGTRATRPIQQPVLLSAPDRNAGSGEVREAGTLAAALAEIPDSLFDHSEDVEFILDPVTLKKGRAHTVVRAPQGPQPARQAVITF